VGLGQDFVVFAVVEVAEGGEPADDPLKPVLRPGQGPHVTAHIVDFDSSLSGVPACLLEEHRRSVETRHVDTPLRQAVGNSAVTAS